MHVNVRYNKIVIITQLCVAYNKNVILSHVTVLSVFEDLDQKLFFLNQSGESKVHPIV